MPNPVTELSDETFADIGEIDAALTAVVFTTQWSAAGVILTTNLMRMAPEIASGLAVRWLDVERSPRIARRLEIVDVPAVLFFRGGHLVGRVEISVVSLDELREAVDDLIALCDTAV